MEISVRHMQPILDNVDCTWMSFFVPAAFPTPARLEHKLHGSVSFNETGKPVNFTQHVHMV
jgi:hypothetical protein